MKRAFTLIEIVVSLAILALSLGGLLQLLISSRLRIAKAWEEWNNMHKLMQGAEYMMLQNEDEDQIPEKFFPYEGYRLDTVWDDVEDLPEDLNSLEGQLPLKCMTLSLVRLSDGQTVEELKIDRISYESTAAGE